MLKRILRIQVWYDFNVKKDFVFFFFSSQSDNEKFLKNEFQIIDYPCCILFVHS